MNVPCPNCPSHQVHLPLPRFPHRGLQRNERPMSQMSHLKQKNGKVLETLLLSPGKTENPRYVLPPRGRRQADTPTIDTTVVRQRLTLRRGVRTRFIASAHSEAKRSAYRCFVGACTLRLAPTRAHPPPNPTPCHYMSPGPSAPLSCPPHHRLGWGWFSDM